MSKPKAPRKVDDQSALAIGRAIRSSARKLNLVAQTIRGRNVAEALTDLRFSPRRVANEVRKVLQAAVANAENNHQLDIDRLIVTEATVGRAFVMKRFHARGRGRGAGIEKPYSQLRIVVRESEQGVVKKKRQATAKAKAGRMVKPKTAARAAAAQGA